MIPARMAVEEVLPKGDGVELGGLVGNLLGGLVGNLLAGLEGEEHGLEAVTKEEAGTQGSACLTNDHVYYPPYICDFL